MPDKWDSPDGQTHDESELIATDEYLTVVRLRLGHGDWWRDATIERILARLDAAERERDALKAAMPKPTKSDDDLTVEIVDFVLSAIEPATRTPADVAVLVRDAIAARVAEAVRPWREVVGPLTNAVDDLRPLGTADALPLAQLVRQARALLEKEAPNA